MVTHAHLMLNYTKPIKHKHTGRKYYVNHIFHSTCIKKFRFPFLLLLILLGFKNCHSFPFLKIGKKKLCGGKKPFLAAPWGKKVAKNNF